MKGLSDANPTHKVRSEFLAMMCFAHLMTEEQVDEVIDNKLLQLDAFLKLFDECPSDQCGSIPSGARFVAGFGQFVATSLKNYIEDNRQMLTDSDEQKVRAAVSG